MAKPVPSPQEPTWSSTIRCRKRRTGHGIRDAIHSWAGPIAFLPRTTPQLIERGAFEVKKLRRCKGSGEAFRRLVIVAPTGVCIRSKEVLFCLLRRERGAVPVLAPLKKVLRKLYRVLSKRRSSTGLALSLAFQIDRAPQSVVFSDQLQPALFEEQSFR